MNKFRVNLSTTGRKWVALGAVLLIGVVGYAVTGNPPELTVVAVILLAWGFLWRSRRVR